MANAVGVNLRKTHAFLVPNAQPSTHLGEGAQRGFCSRMSCGFSQELVGHEEMPLPCRELQIGKDDWLLGGWDQAYFTRLLPSQLLLPTVLK